MSINIDVLPTAGQQTAIDQRVNWVIEKLREQWPPFADWHNDTHISTETWRENGSYVGVIYTVFDNGSCDHYMPMNFDLSALFFSCEGEALDEVMASAVAALNDQRLDGLIKGDEISNVLEENAQ